LPVSELEARGLFNPLPPWDVTVSRTAGGIRLTWTSSGEELKEYRVLRRTLNGTTWVQIGSVPVGGVAKGQFDFMDTLASNADQFVYGVRALGFYGRQSQLATPAPSQTPVRAQ